MAKMNIIKLSKIALVNCLDNMERLFLIPIGGLIGILFAIAFGENNIVALFVGVVYGFSFVFVFQYLFSFVKVLIRFKNQRNPNHEKTT